MPLEAASSDGASRDFFISYNRADRAWAVWIAWQLEAAGYSTVLQAWDFVPGSNFVLEMDKAAQQAKRTIAVLSPSYLAASFPQPEWGSAFAGDPSGAERKLVRCGSRSATLPACSARSSTSISSAWTRRRHASGYSTVCASG
jgi:hypothetical protein